MRALVVVLALIVEFALGFFAGRVHDKPARLIPPISITKDAPRATDSAASRSLVRIDLSWLPSTPSLSGEGVIPAVSPSAVPLSRPAATTKQTSPSASATPSAATRWRSVTPPPAPSTSVGEAEQAGTVWDRLAHCESRGQWHINTGNGYYGGLQENAQFWRSYGNPAYARPDLAPKAEQIKAAVKARDGGRGYSPWPQCAKELGLL